MLKYFDEFIADQFSFRFGIGHSFEYREKPICGVDVFQAHVKILAENSLHDFFLSRAKQPVIDKDAGKLVADCLVQECGGY